MCLAFRRINLYLLATVFLLQSTEFNAAESIIWAQPLKDSDQIQIEYCFTKICVPLDNLIMINQASKKISSSRNCYLFLAWDAATSQFQKKMANLPLDESMENQEYIGSTGGLINKKSSP